MIVDASPETWLEVRRYLRRQHSRSGGSIGPVVSPRVLAFLRDLERDLPSDEELARRALATARPTAPAHDEDDR